MRQIGTLPSERDARRFADYILTRGVKTQVEQEEDGWTVWVYDEDQIAAARDELAGFRERPDDARYEDAAVTAARLRKQEEEAQRQSRRQLINVRQRWERPFASRCPVTALLLLISVVVFLATRVADDGGAVIQALSIASYEIRGNFIVWNYLQDIRSGEIWRLVTPIFIHGSPGGGISNLLHIGFNAYLMYHFGGAAETVRGSLRFLIFVLLTAVLSNLGQYWFGGSPAFGGLSGVVYGLFGYIWMKSRFDPRSGFHLDPTTVFILVGWFLFGIAAADMLPIANWAHGVGLGVGMLAGYFPTFWRKLQRP